MTWRRAKRVARQERTAASHGLMTRRRAKRVARQERTAASHGLMTRRRAKRVARQERTAASRVSRLAVSDELSGAQCRRVDTPPPPLPPREPFIERAVELVDRFPRPIGIVRRWCADAVTNDRVRARQGAERARRRGDAMPRSAASEFQGRECRVGWHVGFAELVERLVPCTLHRDRGLRSRPGDERADATSRRSPRRRRPAPRPRIAARIATTTSHGCESPSGAVVETSGGAGALVVAVAARPRRRGGGPGTVVTAEPGGGIGDTATGSPGRLLPPTSVVPLLPAGGVGSNRWVQPRPASQISGHACALWD